MRLPQDLTGVGLLFLNRDEAAAMLGPDAPPDRTAPNELARILLSRGAERVVLTQGADELIIADSSGVAGLLPDEAAIVDATGAGDALIATTLRGLIRGQKLSDAVRLGSIAAAMTVESSFSVRPDLTLALLETRLHALSRPLLEHDAP
jgi:pseudouridine kinase